MCVCAAVRSVMMTGPSVVAAAASVIEGVGYRALVRNQRCSIALSQMILPQECLGFLLADSSGLLLRLRFQRQLGIESSVYARTTAGNRPGNVACTRGGT